MVSEPSPQPPRRNDRRYPLGLGFGLIPVVLVWLSGAFSCTGLEVLHSCSGIDNLGLATVSLAAAGILYGVEILAMIPILAIKTVRFVGYGMLTMVLIGPVVAVIGCQVITRATHTVS